MKKRYILPVLLLIFGMFFRYVHLRDGGISLPVYSNFVFQTNDAGKAVIPIASIYPEKGVYGAIGRQMKLMLQNYLKEWTQSLFSRNGKKPNFSITYKGNTSVFGARVLPKVKQLIRHQTPFFVGLADPEDLLLLEQLIADKKLFLLFPSVGDVQFRQAGYENVFFFRPSYKKELRALADYAVKNHKKEIAVFYESSEWGERALETLQDVLKEFNLTIETAQSYPQNAVEVEYALDQISKAAPNAIFCLGHPRAAYSFIINALNKGLHNSLFLGMSELNSIQRILKEAKGLDIVVSSVVPNSETSEIELARKYREQMKIFFSFRADTPFYFESYINMQLLVAGLKKIEGEITFEKIKIALEMFKDTNYKGLDLIWDEEDKCLSSRVWINPGIGKKWVLYAD